MVDEDGIGCLCKDKLEPNEPYELVFPNFDIKNIENEFGKIYEKDGRWYIVFEKLQAKNGKIYDSIHSGNTNSILLPEKLPAFTFLRRKIVK